MFPQKREDSIRIVCRNLGLYTFAKYFLRTRMNVGGLPLSHEYVQVSLAKDIGRFVDQVQADGCVFQEISSNKDFDELSGFLPEYFSSSLFPSTYHDHSIACFARKGTFGYSSQMPWMQLCDWKMYPFHFHPFDSAIRSESTRSLLSAIGSASDRSLFIGDSNFWQVGEHFFSSYDRKNYELILGNAIDHTRHVGSTTPWGGRLDKVFGKKQTMNMVDIIVFPYLPSIRMDHYPLLIDIEIS